MLFLCACNFFTIQESTLFIVSFLVEAFMQRNFWKFFRRPSKADASNSLILEVEEAEVEETLA